MKRQLSLLLAGTLFLGSLAVAEDKVNVSAGMTGAGAPLAIHGYDPVSYFTAGLPSIGSAKFTAKHGDAAYRFVSEANRKAFEKNPDAYLPQFGGFCAYGVTVEQKFDGDPRVWAIVDGKLYFNLNPDIQKLWNEGTAEHIAKATKQWSKIRTKAATEL